MHLLLFRPLNVSTLNSPPKMATMTSPARAQYGGIMFKDGDDVTMGKSVFACVFWFPTFLDQFARQGLVRASQTMRGDLVHDSLHACGTHTFLTLRVRHAIGKSLNQDLTCARLGLESLHTGYRMCHQRACTQANSWIVNHHDIHTDQDSDECFCLNSGFPLFFWLNACAGAKRLAAVFLSTIRLK